MRASLGTRDVVLKFLKDGASRTDVLDLERELNMLQLLKHENIVKLVGAGLRPQVSGAAKIH